MKGILIKVPVFLTLILLIASIPMEAFPKDASKNSNTIPKFFQPLNWEANSKKIQSLFPKSRISVMKMPVLIGGGKPEEMTILSIQGLKRDKMGKAIGEVFIDKSGRVRRITYATLGLHPESKSYYQQLVKIYGKLKKIFMAQYGTPVENAVQSDDPQKYPPKSCKWSEPDFDLLLFVLADDQGHWALNTSIQRP